MSISRPEQTVWIAMRLAGARKQNSAGRGAPIMFCQGADLRIVSLCFDVYRIKAARRRFVHGHRKARVFEEWGGFGGGRGDQRRDSGRDRWDCAGAQLERV